MAIRRKTLARTDAVHLNRRGKEQLGRPPGAPAFFAASFFPCRPSRRRSPCAIQPALCCGPCSRPFFAPLLRPQRGW